MQSLGTLGEEANIPLAVMFSLPLSPISSCMVWKLRSPSVDEWIKKQWYIYTVEIYSAIQKKEILPFTTAWMDLESIVLSEISQLEKDKYHMISLICGI